MCKTKFRGIEFTSWHDYFNYPKRNDKKSWLVPEKEIKWLNENYDGDLDAIIRCMSNAALYNGHLPCDLYGCRFVMTDRGFKEVACELKK